MAKNDFKNKFSSTSLGVVWGFIAPIIFMLTYVIVFEYILKTKSSGEYPFVVWFIPGITIWMFLNEAILNASNSIRTYSYLVKKVVFPVDVIPVISIISSFFVTGILVIFSLVVSCFFGIIPNILQIIYVLLCAIIFVISVTRLTSALTTLVSDFGQLLSIGMQLLFWFTPVIWNISLVDGVLGKIIRFSPFTYLITGFREAFVTGDIVSLSNIQHTIVFWIITLIIYVYGNAVFSKNKKDFSDVL